MSARPHNGREARTAQARVGIATRDRPDQLAALLDHLADQSLAPHAITVRCTEPQDAVASDPNVTVIYREPGLPRQRNGVLEAPPMDTDRIVFFDDDFYLDPRWFETVSQAFVDGILASGTALPRTAIREFRFEQKQMLYAWMEDRDFGATVVKRGGRHVKIGKAYGVHLGTKGRRVPSRRLGYSQVMNPSYLKRKSIMMMGQAIEQTGRNVKANRVMPVRLEPYADRRGRPLGNLIAALDLVRLRMTPERAASL